MNNHAEVMIEIRNLCRAFGETQAIQNLSLTIHRGEIFGLVGPDGAGKTTTLRLLAAIMDPDSGTASVAGFDTVKGAEAIKSRIGYMAQTFSLYRDLSVLENINFFADVYGVSGKIRRERIERLLAFARLTEFKSRRAGRLSGGMQKKLGLACTLIHEPEILYLDEPTTGVDPVSRREFWDILTNLHVQGVTILVSTPYMDEAERCSRVGLIYNGGLIACDTPQGIKKQVPGKALALHTSDRFKAREVLRATPGIHEVQSYGELLHIFADSLESGEALARAGLAGAGIEIRDLRPIEARMEEAFISLIRRQELEEERPAAS